jgi:hypothetical protein
MILNELELFILLQVRNNPEFSNFLDELPDDEREIFDRLCRLKLVKQSGDSLTVTSAGHTAIRATIDTQWISCNDTWHEQVK